MVSYKPGDSKKSILMIVTIAIFAVVGTTCIIIGYFNQFLAWLKNFGIATCVLMFPLLIFLIYQFAKKKIKDM